MYNSDSGYLLTCHGKSIDIAGYPACEIKPLDIALCVYLVIRLSKEGDDNIRLSQSNDDTAGDPDYNETLPIVFYSPTIIVFWCSTTGNVM